MRSSSHRKLAAMYCFLALAMLGIRSDATAVCFLSMALLHLSLGAKSSR
jgi:hypothetical protein